MRLASTLVLLLLGSACRSVPPAVVPEAIAGEWTVFFAADSIRDVVNSNPPIITWRTPPERWIQGTLSIQSGSVWRDSTLRRRGMIPARFSIDFRPLLGRQVSCYDPGDGWIATFAYRDSLDIAFVPGGDCGLRARGRQHGDSITGRWFEDSYLCCSAYGRFRMVRVRAA